MRGTASKGSVRFGISVHIQILFKEVVRLHFMTERINFFKAHDSLIPLLGAYSGETLIYFHKESI